MRCAIGLPAQQLSKGKLSNLEGKVNESFIFVNFSQQFVGMHKLIGGFFSVIT